MIDVEHGSLSPRDVQDMIRSADASGMPSLVRAPLTSKDFILRALDAGAYGIGFPYFDDAEEARQAVDEAKYPAIGHRGVAPYAYLRILADLRVGGAASGKRGRRGRRPDRDYQRCQQRQGDPWCAARRLRACWAQRPVGPSRNRHLSRRPLGGAGDPGSWQTRRDRGYPRVRTGVARAVPQGGLRYAVLRPGLDARPMESRVRSHPAQCTRTPPYRPGDRDLTAFDRRHVFQVRG